MVVVQVLIKFDVGSFSMHMYFKSVKVVLTHNTFCTEIDYVNGLKVFNKY